MDTEALPSLNEDTVSLAYQLAAFSKSGHHFVHIIISWCCDLLQFITKHYINFSLSQCSFSSSYSTSENSISQRKRSVDLDSLESQASWFLNNEKFKVRKIQINFLTVITHILDHSFYLSWQRSKSQLLISKMNDECDFSIQNSQFTVAVEVAVQCVLVRMNIQSEQQFTQDQSRTELSIISAKSSTEFNKQFKLKEIEYFDSELSIENESIISDNKLWIQNVFVFIQQIKNIISIQEKKTVRSNIFLCLWKAAVMWYTDFLNDVKKTKLWFNLNF